MRSTATLRWIGLALLGIVVAAAVAVAGSRLASRQIGLASEPITAGDSLAPARKAAGAPQRSTPEPEPTTAAPSEPPAPAPPATTAPAAPSGGADDSAGGGSEEGGGPDD